MNEQSVNLVGQIFSAGMGRFSVGTNPQLRICPRVASHKSLHLFLFCLLNHTSSTLSVATGHTTHLAFAPLPPPLAASITRRHEGAPPAAGDPRPLRPLAFAARRLQLRSVAQHGLSPLASPRGSGRVGGSHPNPFGRLLHPASFPLLSLATAISSPPNRRFDRDPSPLLAESQPEPANWAPPAPAQGRFCFRPLFLFFPASPTSWTLACPWIGASLHPNQRV